MPPIVAVTADSSMTTAASTFFTTTPVTLDLVGSDPPTASLAWTIDAVSGRKFVEFLVPRFLEVDIKQVVNVL